MVNLQPDLEYLYNFALEGASDNLMFLLHYFWRETFSVQECSVMTNYLHTCFQDYSDFPDIS